MDDTLIRRAFVVFEDALDTGDVDQRDAFTAICANEAFRSTKVGQVWLASTRAGVSRNATAIMPSKWSLIARSS